MPVTIRLFASAREAFGASTVQVASDRLPQLCLDLTQRARDPDRLRAILAASSLLQDGTRHRASDDVHVPEGAALDVLPPVAGG